eukprot:scaffold311_cov98-Cylindrotheca_fusiformis.AAC.1
MGYSTEEGFHGYSTAIGIEWDIAQKRFGKRSAFASKIQYGNWDWDRMEYSTEKGIYGYSTAIGIEWDIAREKFCHGYSMAIGIGIEWDIARKKVFTDIVRQSGLNGT